ncbi:MAG: AMP-binding protein [bacterium]|nr:AMP-binding protein [bacterium]
MFVKRSEKPAIVTNSGTISYNQVIKDVNRFTLHLGDVTDERVLVVSENRPEYIYAIYGIWRAGGTAVPVDFMSVPEEISYIIKDCRPSAVFTSAGSLGKVKTAIELSKIENVRIIVFEEVPPNGYSRTELDDIDFANHERTALLIYTSGTTGSPKGVMLSFSNILANLEKLIEAGYYTSDEVVLMILPLHHIFPIMGTVIAVFYGGGATAIVPTLNSADIAHMMEISQPTMILGVPRFFDMLIKGIMAKINASFAARLLFKLAYKIDSVAFSKKIFKSVALKFGGHLRHIISGGAPLNPETWNKFKALGFVIGEGYGMSEAAPMITFPRPGEGRSGCVGKELERGTVKIVDGEVVATGKNIMKGYYNRPEETAEVIKDGWLYTGDLGRFDKDGRLYITGRKKEIIVLPNGKNINPVEIEKDVEALNPVVAECAVIMKNGNLNAIIRPDEKILADSNIPNLEDYFRWEVIDKYNLNASHHKKILDFHLVSEPLPRTRLEKLQRFKLDSFLEDKDKLKKSAEIPDDEIYSALAEYLKKATEKEIFPNDHVEIDLALDSLDKIELAGFISQKWKIRVSEEDLLKNPTVIKLSEFIKSENEKAASYSVDWKTQLKESISIDLPRSAFYHWWIKFYLTTILRFFFRIRYYGYKFIPESPVIFAANHQSVIDGLFVVAKIKPSQFRRTYFFAKEKHFKRKWRKYLANRNNIIIMKDGENVIDSIKRMASVLKKGRNIIIFPEGTRSRDGQLGEFKQTFALLSKEMNVPVVPVAIHGAYDAFPRGRKIPHPFKKIVVEYLPAVDPDGLTQEEITETVKNAIARVVDRK